MRLACPVEGCKQRFEVSTDDPDSTLDDVGFHLSSPAHPFLTYAEVRALVAKTDVAPEDVVTRPVTG